VVEKRTEFPWLDTRISYLEHTLYEITRQANDQAYSGKLDSAVQKWLSDTRDELGEFQYIKRVLSPQSGRIEITGWHLLAYSVIMVVILALFLRYFGG